jgi:hypothetical protein
MWLYRVLVLNPPRRMVLVLVIEPALSSPMTSRSTKNRSIKWSGDTRSSKRATSKLAPRYVTYVEGGIAPHAIGGRGFFDAAQGLDPHLLIEIIHDGHSKIHRKWR